MSRIVPIIRNRYRPEKIILFGSLAHGIVHEWSDIDLAIIKNTRRRFLDRLHEVSFMTQPELGVNFIVYTPDEAMKMVDQKHYFFVDEILDKGKVLYDKNGKFKG